MSTAKQTKYKFNIIDILIILAVIAIGVVMYYYVSARNEVESASYVDIEYTVELKTVHKDYVDKIHLGDGAVETVRDQQIGEIVNIEVAPAYNVATNMETGEMFLEEYPVVNIDDEETHEYYNVKVTIKDTFKKSAEGYSINAFNLVVGRLVYFRVPNFVGEGYCINIVELEREA